MGDARARGREEGDLVGREVDAVGEPDVGAEPAEAAQVLDGAAPVHVEAVALLVLRLREVGVQAHPLVRARSAVRRMRPSLTENGAQGARAIRVMASRLRVVVTRR